MCATSQVMIGITLLLGLLSSNREVVRLTPSRRWRACCCRVCVCARALWLTRSGNAAGQDARVLEHHSARLFPLRRRNCVPHEAPGQQQHVPQAGVAGYRRQGGAAHIARASTAPCQGGCSKLVPRLSCNDARSLSAAAVCTHIPRRSLVNTAAEPAARAGSHNELHRPPSVDSTHARADLPGRSAVCRYFSKHTPVPVLLKASAGRLLHR